MNEFRILISNLGTKGNRYGCNLPRVPHCFCCWVHSIIQGPLYTVTVELAHCHLFVLLITQMINALDYGMGKVADLMMKHVLVPAISNISVAVNVEILDEGGPEHSVSVLRVVPSEEQRVSIL
jgi:hypothetical protein